MCALWWRAGLGLVAGAVLHASALAQVPRRDTTARRDTLVRRDTLARRDTTFRRDSVAARPDSTGLRDTTRVPIDSVVTRDTLKAPLARAEIPILIDDGGRYRWTRSELFVGGGFTLLELLEQIPGVTGLRSGWLASPAHAAYFGNAARIRIFFDGIELASLDPRSDGVLNLSEVQLWTLEEVAVERGADELRVHLRSWRIARTTPYTRTDVATGDEDTNLYRGFFGRRLRHGEAVQFGAQQYGTTGKRTLGGGDELALNARVGWANETFSLDGFGIRARRKRDPQEGVLGIIPSQKSLRTDAYARAALGDPERGAWLQLLAARLRFTDEKLERPAIPSDTVDTTRAQSQYVAAAGFARAGFSLSATGRTRIISTRSHTTVMGRFGFDRRSFALSALAEYRGPDSLSNEEVGVRLSPSHFFSLSGVAVRRHGTGRGGGDTGDAFVAARAEVSVRVRSLWFGGGIITRDSSTVSPLRVFDTSAVAVVEPRTTGVFATAHGRIWKAVHFEGYGVRWDSAGALRPQLQTRADLFVRTSWLRRFPSGNFGFLGSVRHDYRGGMLFPSSGGARLTRESHVLYTLLEIRIVDAVLFYRQRLTLGLRDLEFIPGFSLPRRNNLYGVRWEFWN